MPQQIIAGPGMLLPPPEALYPATAYATAYTGATNKVSLPAGGTVLIPAGLWEVSATGTVSAVQWRDPVTQAWMNLANPGSVIAGMRVQSDGVNWRVANLSDSAYAASVTTAGSGYVQGSTTVTAGTGNSVWQPVVGGALGTFTVVTGGSGYSKTPLVFIPAPPYPGVQATAHATIAAGVVTAVTIDTAGAGYLTAPPIVITPDPFDPNYLSGTTPIVNATATVALTGAGTITAVLLVNFGTALTTAPTLTVNGVGSSAVVVTTPSTVVAAAVDQVTMQPL